MKKLIKRAIEIQAILDQVKPLYQELDGIVLELANSGFTKEHLGKGVALVLVDNYAEKNTCFKATGIRRYELKIKREAM